jgi:hypothetical protein
VLEADQLTFDSRSSVPAKLCRQRWSFFYLLLVAVRGAIDTSLVGGLWKCYDKEFDNGKTIETSLCGIRMSALRSVIKLLQSWPIKAGFQICVSVVNLDRYFGAVITRVGQEFISLDELTFAMLGGHDVNAFASCLPGEDFASMVRMLNGEPGNEFLMELIYCHTCSKRMVMH